MKLPRLLPASPVEESLSGRVFVWAGFAVGCVGVGIYGQDYVIPAIGLAIAALGHIVSYRGRSQKRSISGQALVASLVFASMAYFLADSVGAIFGGVMPQANFAILLVAVTSFDLKTRRTNATLTVTGQLPLLMTDYGITPPKAMLGMLKTDPKVTVSFEAVLAAPIN